MIFDIFYIILVLLKLNLSPNASANFEIDLNNLLDWMGLIIDSLIFCFIKKEINKKNFINMKTDLMEVVNLLTEKGNSSKLAFSLSDKISRLEAQNLKYFVTQSREDFLIEKLMI